MRRVFLAAAAALLVLRAGADTPAVHFRDVSSECGIRFRHTSGSPEKKQIFETMSGGVVLFDYDNDGRIDVFLVNGATFESTSRGVTPARSRLFHNVGGGRFEDVTDRAGIASEGWGMGGCAADYDND